MIASVLRQSLHHASHFDAYLLRDAFRSHARREKISDARRLQINRPHGCRQTKAPASLVQFASKRLAAQRPPPQVENPLAGTMRARTYEAPEKLCRPGVDRGLPLPCAPDRKSGASSRVAADVYYPQLSDFLGACARPIEETDYSIPTQNVRIPGGLEVTELQAVVRGRQMAHTSECHWTVKARLDRRHERCSTPTTTKTSRNSHLNWRFGSEKGSANAVDAPLSRNGFCGVSSTNLAITVVFQLLAASCCRVIIVARNERNSDALDA